MGVAALDNSTIRGFKTNVRSVRSALNGTTWLTSTYASQLLMIAHEVGVMWMQLVGIRQHQRCQ